MDIKELLKLGFTSEQQYLEAQESVLSKKDLPLGSFIGKNSAYSFVPRNSLDNVDYSFVSESARLDCPYKYDLACDMPKVFNQASRSTCIAQALTALVEYYFENKYSFSQQFLYWAIKRTDGSEKKLRQWLCSPNIFEYPDYLDFVKDNSNEALRQSKSPEAFNEQMKDSYRDSFGGALISKAKEVLEQYGICEYKYMPYVPYEIFLTEAQSPEINDENLLMEIMRDAMLNARKHKISDKIQLLSGRSIDTYKAAISGADNNRPMPVVFSVSVFKSWATDYVKQSGWISAPLKDETATGGHAMLAVGYKDTPLAPGGGYLIVRNSWGTAWAWDYKYKGYARIPYSYVEHYADSIALSIIAKGKDTVSAGVNTADALRKYIKIAPKNMKNRKGRFAIAKGQRIIVDSSTGIADAFNDENAKIFINNGYSWE